MIEHTVTYGVNNRGMLNLNGRTLPIDPDLTQQGQYDVDDNVNLDTDVREIIRETEALRALGLLHPFTEGAPIGKCTNRKPPVPRAFDAGYYNQRKQWQREAMLLHRRANDKAIREILNG